MDLSNALDDWHANIPAFLHDTPANIQHYASQGLGRMFVAVYLGYYHFGQLLFYQFLQGDCHSTVLSARFYANKCKMYAERLCEIVYASHSVPNCDVQYTMVGQCVNPSLLGFIVHAELEPCRHASITLACRS